MLSADTCARGNGSGPRPAFGGGQERGKMEESQLKERAQILMDLMNDKAYVPMKAKEIAILLNLPKSQRDELKEVLDYLVAEGKVGL